MPTARPRYTFTDTGPLEALLDAAQERWPEMTDRKALFLRLAEEGGNALALEGASVEARQRRDPTRAALERIPQLIDREVLGSDRAWH